jgi:tetratricopeptide (TPR) repeat protein
MIKLTAKLTLMRIQFKIPLKKNPMTRQVLILITFLFVTSALFSQADSTDHFLQKGILEKEKGRRMESLKNFEKAIKYNAENKAVLNELASAYHDLRKYHKAIETYKKLIEVGDASAANYKQLLNLSFNLKQQDDVIIYANKLKEADPSEKINYYLGKVHYDRENYGEAIQRLNDAAKEDPENGEIPYMIARSYADMMNYKQAIPFFQKAVRLDTSKNHWIYEMALIHYAIHDDKNALKYMLEAGDKGYKRDNDYLENLGIAYLNVGNLDKGVAIMSEILKRKPSDINILNMVAESYYYKGKYQLAIDYWDQILGYDKQNASALYMIGMSYQKKGEKAKGELLCDKAIQMDPSLASLKQKKQMMGL